jgi:26S proteasome regulatory subunit N7
MSIRDLKGAATLFLEAVPTFGSYELISYEDLIFYTVIVCVFGLCAFFNHETRLYERVFAALERPDLRSSVIRCNEIQEQVSRRSLLILLHLFSLIISCRDVFPSSLHLPDCS